MVVCVGWICIEDWDSGLGFICLMVFALRLLFVLGCFAVGGCLIVVGS